MAIRIEDFQAIKAAPQAVFDRLTSSGVADSPRFMVPNDAGGFDAVTWGAFGAMIRGVAGHLVARGLRPGDRALVFGDNAVEWAAAALGIQAAGGVMVPVYASTTRDQLDYLVQKSAATLMFVDARAARIAAGCGIPLIDWTDGLPAGDAALPVIDLAQPGLMLFTSGTSGPPKGVPLSHHAIGANARDWLTCFAPAVTEGDTDLLWLPMSHIYGFGELCLGNTLGWTTWLSSPKRVLADMPRVRPHVFMSVPSVWEKLGQAAEEGRLEAQTGGRIRFCLSGGAGLKVAVKERLRDHGLTVFEGYGLTEASPTLTLNRPGAIRFDTVGQALPSVQLRLADDGEIEARGPNIFQGYHDDPAATAAAFTADGWLKTGDVGRFTADGFLQIIDRKKDILVTRGGKNVAPANIEGRFGDEPLIDHLVVYGDGHKYLVAGVWPNAEAMAALAAEGTPAQLVSRCIERVNAGLMRVETIKKFKVFDAPLTVESGLLTPTLKVKRKAVYAAFGAQLEGLYGEGE